MLVLTRKTNESIIIMTSDGEIEVIIAKITHNRDGMSVRLGIEAPKTIPVHRKEVYEQIKREGRSITKD